MTHRLYPAALIGLVLVVGACSDDGREMKLPTDNQNESIMTTTLAPDDQGSFDTAAPDTHLDDHGSETELFTSWSAIADAGNLRSTEIVRPDNCSDRSVPSN